MIAPHEPSPWRYTNGCRCGPCREAWRQYRRTNVRQRAHQIARNRIATWACHEFPQEYEQFLAEAIARLEEES